MSNVRRRRNGVAEERLEAIKASAVKWFYQRGYAGTDLRLIGNDLNMYAGSLYNYIRSKEELLYLIMKDGMLGISAGLDQALDGLTDPIQRLHAAARFHLLHQLGRRYVAWTNHVEVRALTGDYRAEIMAMRDQYQARWVTLIEDCIEHGVLLPLDARVTAYGFLTMAQGISRWFDPNGRMSAEQIADQLTFTFLRGICRDPDGIALPTSLAAFTEGPNGISGPQPSPAARNDSGSRARGRRPRPV